MINVRDVLMNYNYILDDVSTLQKEIDKLIELQEECRQTSIKAQIITDMPHGTNKSDITSKTFDLLIVYQQDIDNLYSQINEMLTQKKWIEKAFNSLVGEEKRIITLKYIKRYSITHISNLIKRSKKNAHKLIQEAEDKMRRLI